MKVEWKKDGEVEWIVEWKESGKWHREDKGQWNGDGKA